MKNELAFPRPASRGNNYFTGEEDVVVDPQKGMTLRDYFAAKAMNALIVVYADDKAIVDEYSQRAYAIADAMLKARKT
jgi:hypothetical protein